MEDHRHLIWNEKERKRIFSCGIFDIYKSRRYCEDGQEGDFVLLALPNWVTIVPILKQDGEDHFLMVRQYRHGSGKVTLEFPAGTVEPGEDPADTAERELLEETGYNARRIHLAGKVNPNPAFMNNFNHVYIAEDLKLVASQNLDLYERVDTLLVPAREVRAKMGTDPYGNGVMILALWYYERWKTDKKVESL